MEYCSHHGDLMNMSFAVVLDDGSVAGLCPIILDGNDLTYQNGPCPEPLYDNDSVRYELLRHLRAIIDSYLVTSYEFREQIEGLQADDISWQTQVIQLLPRNETERWREVRRSYKSIIHTAQRTHRIERSCDPSAVEILHGLHRDQAGRETRDQYTWDLMASWVASGHAYLCLAWNDAGVCDGAIYVYVYKGHEYYGHAASSTLGVNHALVWEAIRRSDSQTFEVGWQGHASNEKGKNIEFFRRGFGGSSQLVRVSLHGKL
jgi:hypothetical protein|tara:strand:- start:245 stop:1027 length:783 start_codon:yes stop_codon:yes gene_type:complete